MFYFESRNIITISCVTRFFICNTFISSARLKLAKNLSNAKQHPEAELLLFENYSHSSSTLLSKSNKTYKPKNKCVRIYEIIRLILMKMKIKMGNRSHTHDINLGTRKNRP